MLTTVVSRWYNQLHQHIDNSLNAVVSGLRHQAKTQIWARVALDLFFTSAPKSQSGVAQSVRVPSSRPAPPEPAPAASIASSRSAAGRTPVVASAPVQTSTPAPAPTRAATSAPTVTPLVQMFVANYKASAARAAKAAAASRPNALRIFDGRAARYALARQDGIWATGREVDGLARALDLHIAVYMPNAQGQLELRDNKNPFGTARLALILDGNHYTPMRHNPQGLVLDYDAHAVGQVEVPGDGNCFYHSIVALLGGDAHALRQLACATAEAQNIGFED